MANRHGWLHGFLSKLVRPSLAKPGWSIFAIVCLFAAWLLDNGIHNIRYGATLPEPATDDKSSNIEKQIQRLSMWTYIPLWIITITLCVCRQFQYVLPAITLIIGIHFLPQARIFSRTIDYLLAPAPICSSLLAIYIAATTQNSMADNICHQRYRRCHCNRRIRTLHGHHCQITHKLTSKQQPNIKP